MMRVLSSIAAWDDRAFHRVYDWAHGLPGGPALFGLLTEMGNGLFVVLVAVALWIWESRFRKEKAATAGLVFWTYLLSGLLVNLIKPLVGRPRPISLAHNSFPSGHTASAFALAAALSYRWPRLTWFFWLTAALVGLSRVAVGAHYPLDVLVGGVLGALTTWGYLWVRRRRDAATNPPKDTLDESP